MQELWYKVTITEVKPYIVWELIRFDLEKFGEWKILGDLSETAKKNEGMEKLFQEKVSSVVREEWHQNWFAMKKIVIIHQYIMNKTNFSKS